MRSWLICDFSSPVFLKGSLYFIFRLAYSLLRRKEMRFVVLTPGYLKRQIVYDQIQKRFITFRIRNRNDFATACQIFWQDDFGIQKFARSKDILDFYESAVESGKGPLILDCGGHIGLATKYFLHNFPKASIVCIEPSKENVQFAKENNQVGSVTYFNGAVGCTEGYADLVDEGLGNSAFRVKLTREGGINVTSINKILNGFDEDRYIPFIVKIDIEGSELDLFSRDTDWINRFPLLIIELHDWLLPRTANSRNFLKSISLLERDFVYRNEHIFSFRNNLHAQ